MTGSGDTRVDVYLADVTEDQVVAVMEDICDALARRGLGHDDERADVIAVVAARAAEFPIREAADFADAFCDYAQLMLPMAFGPERRRPRPL